LEAAICLRFRSRSSRDNRLRTGTGSTPSARTTRTFHS